MMFPLASVLVAASFLSFSLVRAHMQLSNPYPIDSPLNPNVIDSLRDYSYTNPLDSDGSNYPCKGYQTQTPILYTASYMAGETSNITLAGSATHGGGSCQISLSYDNGKTFKVIKSMMGGCPLTSTYDFTIPSFAPAGNALLAWTWFNKIGNREIYMDCAWVTVASSPSKLRRSYHSRRDASFFNALPDIFLANIPQAGGVKTIEGDEVTFPYPGNNVQYGGSITSSSPLAQGYSGTPPAQNFGSSPPSGGDNSSNSLTTSSTSAPASAPAASASAVPNSPFQSPDGIRPFANITIPIPISNFTSTNDSPAAPIASCSPGTLLCPSITTFALCGANGMPTTSQPVAPGTQCANGAIETADNSGPCDVTTPVGTWLCRDGGLSFSACSNGWWINMGSVAEGTVCKNGVIVAA